MRIFFQCVGITGAVLVFFGLLAFAFTRVSTPFFWSLLAAGGLCLAAFVLTTASRLWQTLIAMLLAANVLWVLLWAGKGWPLWALGAAGGLCAAVLAALGLLRAGRTTVLATAGAAAAVFAAALFLRDRSWYGYAVLAVAFVGNGAFVYLGRIALRETFQKRSLRYGTTAAIYSVLAFAVLIVANVVSQDFHWQKDFTENQVNTLTDQSAKALENLKEPLRITAFFDERNERKPLAKALLDMYGYRSKKVEVSFVDPDKEKLKAEQHKAKDGDILVEYGRQSNVTANLSEEGITQAILKVARTATPTACFTKGHGELDPDGADDSSRSASFLKKGLENEGIVSKRLETVANGVAADCSILVVAGPTQRFPRAEAEGVGKYLDNGGKAFLLLDPRIPDPRLTASRVTVLDTGLEEVARRWGIELGRDFILEKHLELLRGIVTGLNLQVLRYGSHPIVDPLNGKQTTFEYVRSLSKVPGFDGTVTELAMSNGGGASWAKSDVDALFRRQEATPGAKDKLGPVTFAIASERETDGKKTQLVVVGDSDFLSNEMIQSYEFNFDFALNAMNWLAGSAEQISIRPKQMRSSTVDLTPEQTNWVFYIAVVTIPMLVLIFGINLWWVRRRKG